MQDVDEAGNEGWWDFCWAGCGVAFDFVAARIDGVEETGCAALLVGSRCFARHGREACVVAAAGCGELLFGMQDMDEAGNEGCWDFCSVACVAA